MWEGVFIWQGDDVCNAIDLVCIISVCPDGYQPGDEEMKRYPDGYTCVIAFIIIIDVHMCNHQDNLPPLHLLTDNKSPLLIYLNYIPRVSYFQSLAITSFSHKFTIQLLLANNEKSWDKSNTKELTNHECTAQRVSDSVYFMSYVIILELSSNKLDI